MNSWTPKSCQGVAIHNWHGNVRHGLALDVGDFVEIIEEFGLWFRGTCSTKSKAVGLFPKSYIHLKDKSKSDPVVVECTEVLRNWNDIWKRLFVERKTYKFMTLRKVMLSLLESRREILGATLTQDQTTELQLKIISKIDWGNRKLELDLVPRIGALAVDPQKIGLVSLYKVHVNSAQNAKDSSSRGTLRKAKKKILSHHLYLCMRDFGHRLGEDAEIYFYLYDGNPSRMRVLSERFVVRISKNFPKNCTIFTDLGANELGPDLYLVATVLRVGKILHTESTKKGDKSNAVYRRPFGLGVLSLVDFVPYENSVEPEEKEFSFKLFQCEEKDFHQLHELIIKKASGKFSPINVSSQNHYGLAITLKLLLGSLAQAKSEQPLLFEGTTLTRKMGFADVIMPGDIRNDLFLTIERGEFERGGKSTAKNIEVSVCLFDANGKALNQCLWSASGESCLNYRSVVIYHNNSPCWFENLRISLDPDIFATAHIRFLFRHCSSRGDKSEPKIFAFSFVRLMENNGATLADESHELYVYKCEDPAKLVASTYLKLPCSANDTQAKVPENNSLFHRSSKEMFNIRTMLCSTKLTQNSILLHLLQWQSDKENIAETLTRVLKLRDEELVKFLQDVLDALFAMFSNEEGNSTAHSGLVFHVLVSIFSLLQSTKFSAFKPIIDEYIEKHFAAALVYKGLLTSIQHCADWVTTAEKPEPIQKCFESLEYIFKLIIQSRKLFARATGGQFEDSFRRDLFTVFQSLNQLLTITAYDKVLPSQEALLSNLNVSLEQLKHVISLSEVATLASNMLDSVPKDAQPRLIQAKLKAVQALVSGELFHDEELRPLILSVACKHLKLHLGYRDELKLCAETIAEILIHLHDVQQQGLDKVPNTIEHDLNTLCGSILDVLLKTILIIMEGSPTCLTSLVAVTLGLLQQLDESHYKYLWDGMTQGDYKEMKDFLHRSLLVFKELLSQNWQVFPQDWLVMKMAANDIVRQALEEFAKPLVFRFLGQYSFDSQLWWAYFSLAVTFLTQPALQLENYHEAKRRKILNSHGDMRVMMGFQILSMWSQLAEFKLHFIPSMVGPFLEVTLVPEPALRKATIAVFYDMMNTEQLNRGSFRLVESEVIDKLDLLINENKGDESFRELFSTILLARVQEENPIWRESGVAFLSSVNRLLERLLDYRHVMQGDENRDKRMSCTVNLLNFYKNEINRKEMYLRYIYKLHDLHISAENYTEAGFTLKLYADNLSWDKETLTFAPGDSLGQQAGVPEWQRKEHLYHEIIGYFDKGKCWEKGVPLCKELASLYETRRFDYNRLSEILITEAKFFQNILTQIRAEPEYFRVGFYGNGFPAFVRNKQFIYRGLEYERIGAFTQRLQTEFPQAQILTKNCPPGQDVLSSPDQYIQISNVRPIADPNHLCHATVVVPEKIARYYDVNDITRFQHDRPLIKGVIDKDNEFKSLWIERIVMDIAFPLPGILRWFEVCSKHVHELTPVEFACETMQNMNRELHDLIAQYRNDSKRNINPFSMRLQGIIDANVMGGISKYQQAFFTEEFAKNEGKGQAANVQKLKCLILEQMKILQIALELHEKLAPSGVLPLHNRLKERYAQLKQNSEGLGRLKRQHSESIVNTPLPPIPMTMEKRAHSLGHQPHSEVVYEKDDIYTHPDGSRESFLLPEIANVSEIMVAPTIVPPIPTRPKSTGHISLADSPEIPPKKDQNAPPLPPRGLEKRASGSGEFDQFLGAPSVPRRSHKFSVVDISIDGGFSSDQELNFSGELLNEYRDSGLSLASGPESGNLNNLNFFEENLQNPPKTNSNPEFLNILSHDLEKFDIELPSPPPIPPKTNDMYFENDEK